VRWCTVMVKQPGLFLPKFTRFHAVDAKNRSRTQNSQFGLLGQIFCATTTVVQMAAPVRNILDTASYIHVYQVYLYISFVLVINRKGVYTPTQKVKIHK
jgi:hypothetical protein